MSLGSTWSPIFGLTKDELESLDPKVREVYTATVNEEYRLGRLSDDMWFGFLILDFLLFVASVLGIRACRKEVREAK